MDKNTYLRRAKENTLKYHAVQKELKEIEKKKKIGIFTPELATRKAMLNTESLRLVGEAMALVILKPKEDKKGDLDV